MVEALPLDLRVVCSFFVGGSTASNLDEALVYPVERTDRRSWGPRGLLTVEMERKRGGCEGRKKPFVSGLM